jgi:NADPH2:quinone reductase
VNRADVLLRTGAYHSAKLPAKPGLEASGTIVESRDDTFAVGTRVLIFHAAQGLYSQEAIVKGHQVVKIPDGVTFNQAAALPINGITAWYCIHRLLQLKVGESVLICAATSGVGVMAIQIAKLLGARVIAGASSADKLRVAQSLGADETICYADHDLEKEVLARTDGKGVDTVLEIIGADFFSKSLKLLKPFGRIVSLANVSLNDSLINTRDFYPKNASIFGFQFGSLIASGRYDAKPDLEHLLALVGQGKLKPLIYKVWPLEQAGLAHEALEAREVIGKVILENEV